MRRDRVGNAAPSRRWECFVQGFCLGSFYNHGCYNGKNYAASGYDKQLSGWYAKLSSGALPDIRIRAAQIYLMYLGYNPNVIDAIRGPRTPSAVSVFQTNLGLSVTGDIDDPTLKQLINANA